MRTLLTELNRTFPIPHNDVRLILHMVDIHCHILPGVDDGAKTWDEALQMCQMAIEDGIHHIVASPHANFQYRYDRASHQESLDRLRTELGGKLGLSLGCDLHFSYDNLQDVMASPANFTISGTNYLLVELSDYAVPLSIGENLFDLLSNGIQPVITHPERNALLQRRPALVRDWADRGCIIQVTANALTGDWGKMALKVGRWLLDNDVVHVVATDAHNCERRPPRLSPARRLVAKWKGEDVARALFELNPAAIVQGAAEIPYFPTPSR